MALSLFNRARHRPPVLRKHADEFGLLNASLPLIPVGSEEIEQEQIDMIGIWGLANGVALRYRDVLFGSLLESQAWDFNWSSSHAARTKPNDRGGFTSKISLAHVE
jgi:hypothetical protein